MVLMGIDIGSTTIKAGLFSPEGKLLSLGRRETQLDTYAMPDGGSIQVWPPHRLWNCVVETVRECLGGYSGNETVRAVSVTGFGSDTVILDEGGKELFPAISFYEKATIEQMEEYGDLIDAFKSYSITGIRPWYYLSLFRVMWLKKHLPDIYNKASSWLQVTGYINYKLCGEAAIDYSEASTTLAFNQTELNWSEHILNRCGVKNSVFPLLVPAGTVLGTITKAAAEETGLPAALSVVMGGHDNVTSFFAAGSGENEIVAVTGTFESIMVGSEVPVLNREGMENNLVCEKGITPGGYVFWGVQYAGGIIEWVRKTLFNTECDCNEELFACIEETSPGSNGMMLLPHVFGSMTPIEDPLSRGCFIGLSEKVEKADFLRASVEGINFQTRLILEKLMTASDIAADELVCIGGAAYSEFWMQNRADILNMPVKVLNIPEATLLGAAMIAGIGAKLYNGFDEARNIVYRDYFYFEPVANSANLYKDYFIEAFLNFYQATKGINHFLANQGMGR